MALQFFSFLQPFPVVGVIPLIEMEVDIKNFPLEEILLFVTKGLVEILTRTDNEPLIIHPQKAICEG